MGVPSFNWTRRTTLVAGIGLALGTAGMATAQPPGGNRTPETEQRWARQGISLAGKVALVTGSTDGLGREVARQLAALGAFVIVHGRNPERGEEVVRMIRAAGAGDAVFYRADFGSLAGVRAFADEVLARHDRLDVLVNNAAAVSPPERALSSDGYELAFAVNYLAHYLLTYRLLPLLESSAPARVVNVSSMGQTPIAFDDVMMTRSYNPGDAYRRSKLAQVMFTIDLGAELDPARVTVNSLHPARSMNTARVINGGFQPLSTIEEGAEATMQLAVAPELAGRTGLYFNGLNEARANDQAYDAAARAQLRALSVELTGLQRTR